MANLVEFIVKVKDLASGQFGKLASSGGKSFSQLDQGLTKTQKKLGGLGSIATDTGRKLDKLSRVRTLNINTSQIQKAGTEVDRLNGKLSKVNSGKGSRGLGNLIPGGLNGIMAGIMTAAGAGAFFKMGMDKEQTKLSFKTMLGGSDKRANSLLGNLSQFSNATPFSNDEVTKSGRSLLAFGFDEKEILPSLKRVGDVASGLQIPFIELSEIYGKARVQGTLFAEDLNQLAGRGIPIFSELAKVLNVPQSEIKKLASESKITFPMMEQAFTNMTSKGGLFDNMMQKQSQTASGKWSTVMGKASMQLTQFSEKLLPLVNKLVDFSGWLLDNTDKVAMLAGGLTAAYGSFKLVSLGMTTVEIGSKTLTLAQIALKAATFNLSFAQMKATVAQLGLNAAFLASPIFWIPAALAAITAGLIYCWNNFEGFRGFLYSFAEGAKTIFSGLYDAIVGALTFDPMQMAKGISQLTKIGESFADGFNKGVHNFRESKGLLTKFEGPTGKLFNQEGKEITSDFRKLYSGTLGKSATDVSVEKTLNNFKVDAKAPASADKTVHGITGGGIRNLTINVDKFFEDFNIYNTSVNEGIDQLEEKVKEVFLRVLNSANAVHN